MIKKILWWDDSLSVIFVIGLFIINIPQYWKIIKKKTSEGLSLWFMFLGQTASWLSWLNATIYYLASWQRCEGLLNCSQGLSGLGILIFQWFLYWIQYILFIKYYPRENHYQRKVAFVTFIGSHVIMIISALATLYLYDVNHWKGTDSPNMIRWSSFIDVMISIMFLIHYLPQIAETMRLRAPGSISLISLGLMTPGSFLWTYFLSVQGSSTGNSKAGSPAVWIPYLLVAISQLCLLSLCLYFEYGEHIQNWWRRRKFSGYNLLLLDIEQDIDSNIDPGIKLNLCPLIGKSHESMS